jgi:hypothetical protein
MQEGVGQGLLGLCETHAAIPVVMLGQSEIASNMVLIILAVHVIILVMHDTRQATNAAK